MKKYNLSEIMKAAWNLRKMSLKWVTSLSFGECLRRAWKAAKEAAKEKDRAVADEVKKAVAEAEEALRAQLEAEKAEAVAKAAEEAAPQA